MKLKSLFLFSVLSFAVQAKDEFVIPESLLSQVEQGNAEVAYFIANVFYEGSDKFKANADKGLEWMEKAAQMGYPHAILEFADELYFNDKKEQALPWFQKAQDLGMAAAMTKIALYHANGYAGFEKDCKSAYEWYEKAESKENILAFNNHAWELATAADPKCRNPEKAIKVIFDLLNTYTELEPIPWYIWDTKAAVLAAVSDFGQAIKLQEWLIEEMKSEKADTKNYQEHLDFYKKRIPWIEIKK